MGMFKMKKLYRTVNGEIVPLTPEETAEVMAEREEARISAEKETLKRLKNIELEEALGDIRSQLDALYEYLYSTQEELPDCKLKENAKAWHTIVSKYE